MNNYRFGFNGMELDDEVRGQGNAYEFGGRSIYDSRGIRFLSIDPRSKEYPWQSPYAYYKNSPVSTIDYLGLGGYDPIPFEDRNDAPTTKDNTIVKLWKRFIGKTSGSAGNVYEEKKYGKSEDEVCPDDGYANASLKGEWSAEYNIDNESFEASFNHALVTDFNLGIKANDQSILNANGEIRMFDINGQVKFESTDKGAHILVEADAALARGEFTFGFNLNDVGDIGTGVLPIGISQTYSGSFYDAWIGAESLVSFGENGIYGLRYKGEYGVAVLKGGQTTTTNIANTVIFQVHKEGTLGSNHGGVGFAAYFDRNNQEVVITGFEHFGVYVGQGGGWSITLKNPFK